MCPCFCFRSLCFVHCSLLLNDHDVCCMRVQYDRSPVKCVNNPQGGTEEDKRKLAEVCASALLVLLFAVCDGVVFCL